MAFFRRITILLTALNVFIDSSNTAHAQIDAYDTTFLEARRLEERSDFLAAAQRLERLLASHADDYTLALQLGWLYLRAERFDLAQRHYERALTLSQGEAREARQGLALVQARRPVPFRAFPALWFGAQLYGAHPQRRGGLSVSPSLSVQLFDLLLVSATYRFSSYELVPSQPPPPPGAPRPSFQQQDFHVSLGITRQNYVLRAHFGYLWDASNSTVPAYVYGLSTRFSLLGNVQLEAGGTTYTDYSVLRVAGAWNIQLHPHWTLGPTASFQYGNGSVGGSFGAQLAFTHERFGLQLAGRYGDEVRPTYLNDSLVYATNDHIRASIATSARIRLGAGFSLHVGYEWQRLVVQNGTSSTDADGHYVSAGLSAAW